MVDRSTRSRVPSGGTGTGRVARDDQTESTGTQTIQVGDYAETATSFAARAERIYADPGHPAGLGGAARLARALGDRDGSRTRRWLRGRDSYTLHKRALARYPRRPVIVSGPGVQLQADLMDVSSHASVNDGTRYLLTVVDAFSRFAWAVPMRTKSAGDTSEALERVVAGSGYRYLQTDKGKEFKTERVRALLNREGISWFSSEDDTTNASLVERFNRMLRQKIHVYVTDSGSSRYLDKLDAMVGAYNSASHSSTGMAPVDVSASNSERVYNALHEPDRRRAPRRSPTMSPGDHARIVKFRRAFDRGYTPNWTREIFVIVSVRAYDNPPVYVIKDLAGDVVDGTFYETELQRVDEPRVFTIERVIRRRRRGARRESFVKWAGYPESFNSWVPDSDFV